MFSEYMNNCTFKGCKGVVRYITGNIIHSDNKNKLSFRELKRENLKL